MDKILKAELLLFAYYSACSVIIVLEGPRAPISWTIWTLLYIAGSLELAGLAKGVQIVLKRFQPTR